MLINSINAFEMWDGYKKGSGKSGPYVVKPYLVDWALADQFVDGVLGGVVRIGTFTQYTTRHACPENPTLYATQADVEYYGERNVTNAGTPNFLLAKVTVTYNTLTWDEFALQDPTGAQSLPNEQQPGQPHLQLTQEFDIGSEFIAFPDTAYTFVSDGKSTEAKQGVWVGNATLQLTRKEVPYLPYTLLFLTMNHVNDDVFLGQATGTVLFAGAKTHREHTSDGASTQDVAMTFKWRQFPWNYAPRPDTGRWAAIQDTGGQGPYLTADLAPLLTL